MSLKNVKAALKDYGRITGNADAAQAEIEALEKAAKVFAGYSQNRFPTREALGSATKLMESIAKEAK